MVHRADFAEKVHYISLTSKPFASLISTQFAENQLTGPLPDEIRHMGNLRTFSVHNNDAGTGSHTGPLPKFDRHPFLKEI